MQNLILAFIATACQNGDYEIFLVLSTICDFICRIFSKLLLNIGVKFLENSNLFAELRYRNMMCLLAPSFLQSTSLIFWGSLVVKALRY